MNAISKAPVVFALIMGAFLISSSAAAASGARREGARRAFSARAASAHKATPPKVPTRRSRWGYRKWDGRRYEQLMSSRIQQAKQRIHHNVMRARLRRGQRARIFANVAEAERVLRQRVRSVSRDGVVTGSEARQISQLRRSIRQELSRYFGRIDSWELA